MEGIITLQCWIHGDAVQDCFPVKGPHDATVFDLKELIQDKAPELKSVAAKLLDLYAIRIRDDAAFNDTLKNWSSTTCTKLNTRQKLSTLIREYQEPLIIIERPSMGSLASPIAVPDRTLNCWVLGDHPKRAFPVQISSTKVVAELKKAIQNEYPEFRNVNPHRLDLYKICELYDDKIGETLDRLKLDQAVFIQPLKPLSYYFPDDPPPEHIHVVVVDPSLSENPTAPPPAEEDDTLALLIRAFKINITPQSLVPCHAAKSGGYAGIQAGERKLLDCRWAKANPVNTIALPIQLFHPVFAFFSSKAFDPQYDVPDEAVRDARDLMAQFALIYNREDPRQSDLQLTLSKVIGRPFSGMHNSDRTSPDLTVTGECGHLQTYLVVCEVKNEVGDGGSDPSTQAAFSFQRIFAQSHNAQLRQRCCCPAFAIGNAGPWLTIMGCILIGNCIVQRLTDFLWIPVHSTHDDKQFFRIARIFYALRESIELLDTWYKDTVKNMDSFDDSTGYSRFFPSPNVYRDGHNLVEFKYEKPLEADVSCVTYLAKTVGDDPKDIVVKFVTSYGADAHQYMASVGLAPQLLYYGRIDVEPNMPSYGDLRMVVMEHVKGMALDKASKQGKFPHSVESELREALERLHDADYVFGDLRPPNVMITCEDRVNLIDFDWAGKNGEAKYPVAISGAIPWPKGARGLALIRKEHDETMRNALLAWIQSERLSRGL